MATNASGSRAFELFALDRCDTAVLMTGYSDLAPRSGPREGS
jgi:hypothetical protein